MSYLQYHEDMFNKVHDDDLLVMGGYIPLDARVSWVPPGATGFQPSNAYLMREGEASLLVESGIALHSEQILSDLASAIGEGGDLSVFFTRAEMDCVSNLEPISRRFNIERLFTGGVINPFDGFEDVSGLAMRGRRVQIGAERSAEGDPISRSTTIELTPERVLEIESPLLRLLPTFWGWDAKTGTLFTSDTFTHGIVKNESDSRFIDSSMEDTTTKDQVAGHLFAKYEWLPRSTTEPIREWLREKFAELDPEAIAPSRGCVIRGKETVSRHLELMLAALATDQNKE